jgi:hypothetical protein
MFASFLSVEIMLHLALSQTPADLRVLLLNYFKTAIIIALNVEI